VDRQGKTGQGHPYWERSRHHGHSQIVSLTIGHSTDVKLA
jgi:hypothetical protein